MLALFPGFPYHTHTNIAGDKFFTLQQCLHAHDRESLATLMPSLADVPVCDSFNVSTGVQSTCTCTTGVVMAFDAAWQLDKANCDIYTHRHTQDGVNLEFCRGSSTVVMRGCEFIPF